MKKVKELDRGWQLQGFIEDAEGRLRLQSDEEHRVCMGCHDGIGVTVDQTFSFPRTLPGAEGWRYQDLRGIPTRRRSAIATARSSPTFVASAPATSCAPTPSCSPATSPAVASTRPRCCAPPISPSC